MRLLSFLARHTPNNRHLRFVSTLVSTNTNDNISPAYQLPDQNEISPIVRALKTAYQPPTKEKVQRIQRIPHPHLYDVTDYLSFLSHSIVSIQKASETNEFKGFLETLEKNWLTFFQYIQKNKLYYLLTDITRKDHFQFFMNNFKLEFQRQTFNAISYIDSLSKNAIKLSENLRKTPFFTENEYEKLSAILRYYGVAKYRRSTNYSFEKDRYQQFLLLIEEMKSQSLRPTVNICLDTVESLFHINAAGGDSIVPVMRAILEEHPELAKHPRMIILSSSISSRLDVVETTKKLHGQGCPVNGENIHHLMQGIVYGDRMLVDRYHNFVPSRNDLQQVYNITTNELLPYLTQSNIDLFFKAAYSADATVLALRFYLIIRNAGYYPGKNGFNHLLLLYARHKDKSDQILTLWEDISEVYYSYPPPWAFQGLVIALCISKGTEGVWLFNRILRDALRRDGTVAPSASHWVWSPDMCAAKFRGYSWAKSYKDVYTLLRDIRELKIPLTPNLIEASFMAIYNRGMFKNYFPKLLQVLFESPTPLCASAIREGISKSLFRNQASSKAIEKASDEIDILGVKVELSDDKEDGKSSQKVINSAIASSALKFILDENYRRRVYSKNKIDIMQIYSVEFRNFFKSN